MRGLVNVRRCSTKSCISGSTNKEELPSPISFLHKKTNLCLKHCSWKASSLLCQDGTLDLRNVRYL